MKNLKRQFFAHMLLNLKIGHNEDSPNIWDLFEDKRISREEMTFFLSQIVEETIDKELYENKFDDTTTYHRKVIK